MLQESYFNNAGFALAGGISAADTVISSAITMPEAGLIEGGGASISPALRGRPSSTQINAMPWKSCSSSGSTTRKRR
jgi:hypothetical protein